MLLQLLRTSIFERQASHLCNIIFYRESTVRRNPPPVRRWCTNKFECVHHPSHQPDDCRLHRHAFWRIFSQSEPRIYVRLAFLSPRERSLRPIFLHEGPLAVAPTIITGWRTCARPQHGRCGRCGGCGAPTLPCLRRQWQQQHQHPASTSTKPASARLAVLPATFFEHANLRAAFISFSYHHPVLPFLYFYPFFYSSSPFPLLLPPSPPAPAAFSSCLLYNVS